MTQYNIWKILNFKSKSYALIIFIHKNIFSKDKIYYSFLNFLLVINDVVILLYCLIKTLIYLRLEFFNYFII